MVWDGRQSWVFILFKAECWRISVSVRSCRAQQMLFVVVVAIVVESRHWQAQIGSSSRQQEPVTPHYWLSRNVSQLLVPPSSPPLPGRASWTKVWATLWCTSKLTGCAWRSLRSWRGTERRTANMKLCRTFLGSYHSLVLTSQAPWKKNFCVSACASQPVCDSSFCTFAFALQI